MVENGQDHRETRQKGYLEDAHLKASNESYAQKTSQKQSLAGRVVEGTKSIERNKSVMFLVKRLQKIESVHCPVTKILNKIKNCSTEEQVFNSKSEVVGVGFDEKAGKGSERLEQVDASLSGYHRRNRHCFVGIRFVGSKKMQCQTGSPEAY